MILQNWWFASLLPHKYPPIRSLTKEIKVDVAILGGGMTGVSAAAAFIGKGLKVALLERNVLGGSSTGRSAGFLTPDSELELSQLERRFGIKGAVSLWQVPVDGIQLILRRIREFDIDCDLVKQDSLFVGLGKSGREAIDEERESRLKAGFSCRVYKKEEVCKVLGSQAYNSAVRYSDTYGISALQFVQGMKKVLLENGIEVYEATEARQINGHCVLTHSGCVTADQIIVAMDKIEPAFSSFSKEIYHAQTFLCISEPLSEREHRSLFPSGEPLQCWDSSLVYSYWRMTGSGRLMLGGGSALTTFINHWYNKQRVIKHVVREFKKRFPDLKDLHFSHYWPGLIDTTRDLLPTVVRDKDAPHIHYILGVVGLPWASFCGDFVSRVLLNEAADDEFKYFSYFSDRRYFFLPTGLQRLLGKPVVFSLNNVWAKYEQVDVNRKFKFSDKDF